VDRFEHDVLAVLPAIPEENRPIIVDSDIQG
jgi:hypothetical protein